VFKEYMYRIVNKAAYSQSTQVTYAVFLSNKCVILCRINIILNQLDKIFQGRLFLNKPKVNTNLKINNRIANIIGSLNKVSQRMALITYIVSLFVADKPQLFCHILKELPVTLKKTIFLI